MINLLPVYSIKLVREREIPYSSKISSSLAAHSLLAEYLKDADREHFVVLLLDAQNQVIGLNTVAIGSLTAATVHPREVFKPAILANANAVMLCHNHPSGDLAPSEQDLTLTRLLVLAGQALGIKVVDHLIISDNTYLSFVDEKLL